MATSSQIISQMLDRYGLAYSTSTVNRWVGLLSDNPQNIVLIEEEIKASPQFNERFPGLQARVDNGYNAISVDEYLTLEDQYRSIFRNAGMPPGFYDEPADLAEFVAHDVAAAELDTRLVQGFVAAQQAPAEVREALQDYYGLPDGEAALAAYFLDPERGLEAITKQFESAQIAARAQRSGYGQISREMAEDLQGYGVTADQALAGFGQLSETSELFGANLGSGRQFSEQEKLAATFKQDGSVRAAMRRQQEQRQAEFGATTTTSVGRRGAAGASSGSDV